MRVSSHACLTFGKGPVKVAGQPAVLIPTRWNLRKPEIGSAGAGWWIRGFHVVAHGGRGGTVSTDKAAIPWKPRWKPSLGNRNF